MNHAEVGRDVDKIVAVIDKVSINKFVSKITRWSLHHFQTGRQCQG